MGPEIFSFHVIFHSIYFYTEILVCKYSKKKRKKKKKNEVRKKKCRFLITKEITTIINFYANRNKTIFFINILSLAAEWIFLVDKFWFFIGFSNLFLIFFQFKTIFLLYQVSWAFSFAWLKHKNLESYILIMLII